MVFSHYRPRSVVVTRSLDLSGPSNGFEGALGNGGAFSFPYSSRRSITSAIDLRPSILVTLANVFSEYTLVSP